MQRMDVQGRSWVVNRAQRRQPDPFFDKTRNIWVAPWRKADGRMGRPTGRTRAAAEASRNRHTAEALEAGKFAPLAGGFHADTSPEQLVSLVAGSRRLSSCARHDLVQCEKQLHVVKDRLGDAAVRKLRPEHVAGVIADIAQAGSAARARNIRMLLVQLLDEAVNLGLAEDNVARRVHSPRVPKVQRRTLSPAEVARLVSVCDERHVAAVALCFLQGWRVSEALGLAWQDLDLVAGNVRLRRGATYADRIGMVLGPPKTSRTAGRQLLAPMTLTLLTAHRDRWQRMRDEQAAPWPEVSYQGELRDLVFVNPAGRSMLRQHVDKAIRKAAEASCHRRQRTTSAAPSRCRAPTSARHQGRRAVRSGRLDLARTVLRTLTRESSRRRRTGLGRRDGRSHEQGLGGPWRMARTSSTKS